MERWGKSMGTVAFQTFEQIHGKKNVGSTNIRVHQLIKYWPQAELYKYGSNPDVLIFQKVYWLPDYKLVEHFEGIKILDICDPDWLDNIHIKHTVDNCHAVVVPTKAMQEFMQQLTDKPVRVIKDRFDLEFVPKLKVHKPKEQLTAVWFGYHHNAEVLRYGAVKTLEDMGIRLVIISDDDPAAWRWASSEEYKSKCKFLKYNEETIYEQLQQFDIAILPADGSSRGRFKSENKTIKAQLAGLPVARTIEELEELVDNNKRNDIASKAYKKAIKEYDVKLSVKEYKELIDEIRNNRTK